MSNIKKEMASNNMFRNLALILALLLVVSVAESSKFSIGLANSPPFCNTVYGAQQGDTCADVARAFNLSTEFFGAINPNLNCDAIFIGQWLCVAGSA